ncbi:very short patch repair endonuclease (plasmid) [Lactiplantibacillus plantarum]|uniref:very short patch repair endonuclease n=1 Tax=Lactiplantibacillus plantarum TaxID=1590 RepID=UPI0022303968|nr:very short patch repair endonuclease [Lactiplantibacillus plantarum]MCG0714447.1 Very short patch repair protein [Lactiplantibacillus plantarum]MCG0896363.1 Very short patch repair protein [Lactiplantibacillus plantarum]UZD35038.1 very short patch repair endonuclease [Lactiplantibacillus plantarum]WHQ52918.1 very short patch repair endonuclease [Lactiplantibacillus plantarum]
MKHPKSYDTNSATRKRMSNVHLKRGKTENKLALALWHQGIRYRRNYKALPGSPDIAITKYKIAIFIDGEFWHGQDWDNRKKRLKRNRDYWIKKIEENMARDKRDDALLQEVGWLPLHFWDKTVLKNLDYCVELIQYQIRYRKEEE